MSYPNVSVLMSVHNGAQYLREAIESILNQTYSDFEFLIINDASTDDSRSIIENCCDNRIKIIDNETNLGLTLSLNKGLVIAKGKYLARFDCDDLSLPTRLERQVAYMDAQPEVGVCGTWVETIGDTPSQVWQYPTDPALIESRLVFESTLAHPSVMINKELFEKNNLMYDPAWLRSQDYELWARCAKLFPLANIDEVLVRYRLHDKQIGREKGTEQQKYANMVRERELHNMGVSYSNREFQTHLSLSLWKFEADREFILNAESWLQRLHQANAAAGYYPEPAFSQVLGDRWYAACNAGRSLGMWAWNTYIESPLSHWAQITPKQKAGFWLRALARIN